MVVRDQNIIYSLRQVTVSESLRLARIVIADDRVAEDAHPLRFNRQAGMAEIAYPDADAIRGGRAHSPVSEKCRKHPVLLVAYLQKCFDVVVALGRVSHFRQLIKPRIAECQRQMNRPRRFKSRGVKGEGA